MADNLSLVKQQIDIYIDPNGAPGSILAQNHNQILTEVLSKVGKYTGSPFIAKKNITSFGNGVFSWNGNAMNNTNNFTVTTSKLTADLNDFGTLMNQLKIGSIIRFKDYVGRSVFLEFQSFVAGTDIDSNDIYFVTVKGFANNPNYIYQDSEQQIAMIEFSAVQITNTNEIVNGGSSSLDDKIYIEVDLDGVEVGDAVVWGGTEFKMVSPKNKRVDMEGGSVMDLSKGDTFIHDILTAPIVLSFSNIPTTDETIQVTTYLTGEQSVDPPVGCTKLSGNYDGAKMNQFVFEIVNGATGLIYYSIITAE